MEAIAAAIVRVLADGAQHIAKSAAREAYEGAKSLLQDLVPRFDCVPIEQNDRRKVIQELADRLSGLSQSELCILTDKFRKLAEVTEFSGEAESLRGELVVLRNRAGGSNIYDLEGDRNMAQRFTDLDAGRDISITTRIKGGDGGG